jgi:type IV pilus assembly protein PilM
MAGDSIWKKEIRLRGKRGPSASTPPSTPSPGEQPVSIWKREVRLRKPVQFAVPVLPAPGPEAELPVTADGQNDGHTGRFEPAPEWDSPAPQAPFEAVQAEAVADAAPAPTSVPEVVPAPVAAPLEKARWAPVEPNGQSEHAEAEVAPALEVESAPPAASEPPTVAQHVAPVEEGWLTPWALPSAAAAAAREPEADRLEEPSATAAPDVSPPPVPQVSAAPAVARLEPPSLPVAEPLEQPESHEAAVDEAAEPAEAEVSPPVAPAFPTTWQVSVPVEAVEEHREPMPAPPTPTEPVVEPAPQPLPGVAEPHDEAEPAIEPAPQPLPVAAEPDDEAEPAMEPEPEHAASEASDPEPSAAVSSTLKGKSRLMRREAKPSRRQRRKAEAALAAAAVVEAAPVPTPVAPPVKAEPKQSPLKREIKLSRPGGRGKANVASAKSSPGTKTVVGLRIGSSQVAAACVRNDGAIEVDQLARMAIPRGIVSSGEVRDPEALTRELKRFFTQNKLPRRGVRLGIASNRIGVRILEVPKVDDPKLFENSIRFHAQEVLPIAVTDAILDHVVLGEGSGPAMEPTVRLLLVFAHRELVERHVDACRQAGLKLEGIDFEAFALLRALSAPLPDGEEPTRAVVAVAVGNERTIFAVSDGRTCDFTRVLEWGGGTLDVAIARALDLTPSQAEPIKLALALDGDVAPSQLSPEQVATARTTIRAEIQTLARELVSSLQFYQSRPESLDIGAILLSGGGSELIGFAHELERLVGVPVELGDPLGRVTLGRNVHRPAEPGSLAVAIGLGIEA